MILDSSLTKGNLYPKFWANIIHWLQNQKRQLQTQGKYHNTKNQEREIRSTTVWGYSWQPLQTQSEDTVSGSESERVNTERSPRSLQPGTTTALQERRLHRHPKGNSEQTPLTRGGTSVDSNQGWRQKRQSAGGLAYRGHSSPPTIKGLTFSFWISLLFGGN